VSIILFRYNRLFLLTNLHFSAAFLPSAFWAKPSGPLSPIKGTYRRWGRDILISKKIEGDGGGDCGGGAHGNYTPWCSRLGRARTWFRQESYLPPSIPSTARPPGDCSRAFRYYQAARTKVSKLIFQFHAISSLTCSDLRLCA
jgi:hypothetical protein